MTLTKAQRQKIARDKYRKSERGRLRKKLRRGGLSGTVINAIIRSEFPGRASPTSPCEAAE